MPFPRALFVTLCVFAVSVAVLPDLARAQGTEVTFGTLRQNPDLPVEVSAQTLSVNQETGTAVFTGNVVIGQGAMRLNAPRVLVVYTDAGNGIRRLEASGGVTLVSGNDAAEARNANYNVADGVIVMTGDVLLTQGANALTSDRMVVQLREGTARMEGRVRTILQPQGGQ